MFIHSFIHSGYFNRAFSSPLLFRRVTRQNGSEQNGIRTKWCGQNGARKKWHWTKWYGQNYKMVTTFV